jgi:pimeloyl-ACP methyl ester carboxylesterase
MIGVMTKRINLRRPTAALLVPALLVLTAPGLAADRYQALDSCELSAAAGRITATARCGRFEVAENPDDADSRRIELAYAILPARNRGARPDPVFFLAGGPGQSARETLPMMRAALREVHRNRDLIFLDQRGTGGSNKLDCRFEDPENWLELDFEAIDQQLRACHRQWQADVRHYTTAHGAADLEQLRQRYGFEQINLIGGSYGTRMAQVYLRQYPDRVRSVIIDGVVPTRLHLGSEHGLKLDQTLARLFAACGDDPACNRAFPDLADGYASLLENYRDDDGMDLVVTHPRTGQAMDLHFSRDVLASALRFLAYSPQSQMMIPYLVHEAAATGNPSRLASQALIVQEQLDDLIAIGLNFAVGCSEDWPGWPRHIDQSHTLLGDSMLDFYDTVCAWWPAGEVARDFHQPFSSDVPMLILSGQYDPVTPPEYGEEATEQFANSRHLVGAGLGHIVVVHPCFGNIAAEFIEQADVAELDTECMAALGQEPFFLNLLGPSP